MYFHKSFHKIRLKICKTLPNIKRKFKTIKVEQCQLKENSLNN